MDRFEGRLERPDEKVDTVRGELISFLGPR